MKPVPIWLYRFAAFGTSINGLIHLIAGNYSEGSMKTSLAVVMWMLCELLDCVVRPANVQPKHPIHYER